MQTAYSYDDVPRCMQQFTGKERDSESGLDYFGLVPQVRVLPLDANLGGRTGEESGRLHHHRLRLLGRQGAGRVRQRGAAGVAEPGIHLRGRAVGGWPTRSAVLLPRLPHSCLARFWRDRVGLLSQVAEVTPACALRP